MEKVNVRSTFKLMTMLAVSCNLAIAGCTEETDGSEASLDADTPPSGSLDLDEGMGQTPLADEQAGKSTPVEKLPFVDPIQSAETFIQLLPEPTEAGENVALHMKLPPTHDKELGSSLVRVVGDPKNPLVVFDSNGLVEIGVLDKSPGEGFFTAFVTLDEQEIERRKHAEETFASAEKPSETIVVFNGRTPIGISTGLEFSIDKFFDFDVIPLGACPIAPLSELARWEESLMITDLDVVQDADRTNDACGGGNPDGVWTFKHLMEQMAIGSGLSTHDFVVDWLEHWLNDYTVNGDTLPARLNMFHQVIKPWADASGITASLGPGNKLILGGELSLKIAPFRLSAIVNRIDLGGTATGPGGYGGGTVSSPTDAGELRFVFGVQNLNSCNVMRFSVIFEYGVPITGCEKVRDWAVEWTKLNDPSFAPRFSDPWRDHLEKLTESVVTHGAAPKKGNQNAINQIRTNENALNSQWEFREFTLTKEDPKPDTNTPIDGPLRPHTVAMTPDDTVFHPTPNGTIDHFVDNVVLPGVPSSVATLPGDCSASFSVPGWYLDEPFRGGNSFTAGFGPGSWAANINPSSVHELCARHQFSLNTCNGCHFDDTATPFFHVDPGPMPAGLSNFLTGGSSGVWTVPDSQFPGSTPDWEFRDLDLRFARLYEIACAPCGKVFGTKPDILDFIAEIAGVVPIDPLGDIDFPHEVGPIKDLDVVKEIVSARVEFASPDKASSVELDHFVRQGEFRVH